MARASCRSLHASWVTAVVSLMAVGCAQPEADVALRDATIVDVVDGSIEPGQTVLIEGGRIVTIGPVDEVRMTSAAVVLDAAGGYLIPGLWDMHAHSVRDPDADPWGTSLANSDWHFPLLLAHGVTGVRNMNDAAADTGLELSTSVKRRLAAGELLGPRLLVSGYVDGDPPV